MIAQINALIDSKLQLLYNADNQMLPLAAFKNSGKSKLQDARILAEMKQRKALISPYPEKENHYQLTDFGRQICEEGGWIMHLEQFQRMKSAIPQIPEATDKNSWKNAITPIFKFLIPSAKCKS